MTQRTGEARFKTWLALVRCSMVPKNYPVELGVQGRACLPRLGLDPSRPPALRGEVNGALSSFWHGAASCLTSVRPLGSSSGLVFEKNPPGLGSLARPPSRRRAVLVVSLSLSLSLSLAFPRFYLRLAGAVRIHIITYIRV